MKTQPNRYGMAPGANKVMAAMEAAAQASGLEPSLVALVKIRAAEIHGCAFCEQMHARAAEARGETAERIERLGDWRSSSLYTRRERAELAWTEAVTEDARTPMSDRVLGQAQVHFDEDELVKLTLVVTTVDAWHRIAVGFRRLDPVAAVA